MLQAWFRPSLPDLRAFGAPWQTLETEVASSVIETDEGWVVSLPLPHGADPERIDASIDGGVLTVRVAKAASAKRRRIPIVVKGEDGGEEGRALAPLHGGSTSGFWRGLWSRLVRWARAERR